jgi:hypothetical protein
VPAVNNQEYIMANNVRNLNGAVRIRNVGSYVIHRITRKPEAAVMQSAMLLAFARSFKGWEYAR